MSTKTALMWFRQDLRLSDNPALSAAAETGAVLPVFILETEDAEEHAFGGASKVWLHHSLAALNQSLDGHLIIRSGKAEDVLDDLIDEFGADAVFWNRCYEPWRMERDKRIKADLRARDLHCESFNASLLWEPWDISKADGKPYQVFTPFYRKGCLQSLPPRSPMKAPEGLKFAAAPGPAAQLDDLNLLPRREWGKTIASHWEIGEKAAQSRLAAFLESGINGYKEERNIPSKPKVSRLSPHLHFGEISPHQVWAAVHHREIDRDADHFLSELGWREFSYNLLYNNPQLPEENLQEKFDAFPWRTDAEALRRWKKGMTGYPLVDAGMRELWQTGYMHNRIRMVVGSFLVKNLLMDWREGEKHFWNCLFDADLANNSASWQWIAGCGADAAPYFRVFNPVLQGEKFDPDGSYTRHYVPELANLPDKFLFKPWDAPELVLKEAGISLGDTYPRPIVDVKASRDRALAAFKSLSEAAA
ncbi:deoxyribodipyrimidine photo-lyase [Pseudovibrio sp. SPO723]|uniref:cryptochrome/photolyase family protein n=1 Tax=Nesiotobacter zosterae TaxID=392721 RepID=UPI0029C55A7A|nr:deoxyribodipyrimidine photo-lyase [Pseudovibrio sp. SPO723]MDX5592138.1 deoxyribodipyrimidine photo-lyase [Pseudovibrio sp. SPO723]